MATNSAYEQLILELINRARLDPAAEASRLGIGLNDGITGTTISTVAKQVLAANPLLVDAARGHSQWIIDTDTFAHTGAGGSSPTARMQAAGYSLTGSWATGENIAWAGTTGSLDVATYTQRLHDNLFKSAGHRLNILNDGFREIGIGELTGNFNGYNAAVVTENFARSGADYFVTGVAITDADGDEFYDIGEGRSGIAVTISGQGSDVTETAGGFKVAVSGGTHSLTFSGGGLSTPVTVTVVAGNANAKVDLVGANKILSSADTTLGAGARNLSLLGVAALDGTGNDFDNVVRGNRASNSLDGSGGNDTIYGLAGNDIIEGGSGFDTIGYLGRSSDFTIVENADGSTTVIDNNAGDGLNEGRDTLRGAEYLRFDGSNETISLTNTSPPADPPPPAGDPAPVAATTEGDDDLTLGDGGETVAALGGNDIVRGGLGNDTIHGAIGDDVLFGDAGLDRLFGGDGNDRGLGGDGNDWIDGGNGNDVLIGGNHNDLLFGNNGLDFLRGGNGNDRLLGGNDADQLYGDNHNDFLDGGNGNDRLFGGGGNDRLFGRQGNDRIDGDGGRDTAFYGGGSGRYDVDELANGSVRVTDLRGNDGVDLLIDIEAIHFANGTVLI